MAAAARPADAVPARMLVFAPGAGAAPWPTQFLEALRVAVRAQHPDLAFDVETMLVSPDSRELADEMPAWLAQKYAGQHYDIVLAGNVEAVDAAVQLRDRMWPDATVLVPGVNEVQRVRLARVPRLAGVLAQSAVERTLKMIFDLLPRTRHVAVIAGSLDDDPLRPDWDRSLAVLEGRASLIDLSGMPIEQLRERVRHLPPDSVVFFAAPGPTVGRVSSPQDLVEQLAAQANAPMFIDASTLLGNGAVGGALLSPQAMAAGVARQIEQVLAGTRAEQLGFERGAPLQLTFDWRALQRWEIPTSRLPPGSRLIEAPPGLWEAYHSQVLVGVAVLVIQSGLIVALLVERRRRRQAELRAREHLATLARLNRGVALGALSAALAHEINQPLAAILSNAETAELVLAREGSAGADPAVQATLRELLAEIREDDQRAAAVLGRLRNWIANVPGDLRPMALNPLVAEVAQMLHTELRLRDTELQLALAPALPSVVADGVQVQQVVLNLLVNALESLQAVPARQRRVVVSTARQDAGHVAVTVHDNGPGLRGAVPERLFEPFFSTKPQGLGVGLAISRSIIERHCGHLRVAESADGVRFCFTLPVHRAATGATA
jgi:signal transduction histidine kinase